MRKEIMYSIKSPYRENMDIIGFRFGGEGKSIAVTGGIRGNEIQQMYVCAKLVQELKKIEGRGEFEDGCGVLVVPCINYYSMNIGKRFWTMDNTDINRMFPGYDLGETTQRIADGLFKKLQGYEYGVHLASFYQTGNFLPHVKLMETGFTDPELMKLFGLRYGIIRSPRPYDTTTLNYNWQIWETKAFSMYTSDTDTIDEDSAVDAVEGILRFMTKTGMIKRKLHPGFVTELIPESSIEQIRARKGGIFMTHTKIGKRVEENELLGKIIDPLEADTLCEIRADNAGIVYFEYRDPLISENTVCFKLIKDN